MTCRPASRRQTSAYWATPQDTRLTVRTPRRRAGCSPVHWEAATPPSVQAAASVYPGVGDDAESWAIDGVRKLKWYKGQARHSEEVVQR